MNSPLGEKITQHLKYVDGYGDILGKFYYLTDPEDLAHLIENWMTHTPEGRSWIEDLGFVNKEAMVQVIAQIESNLAQSNRDLITKIQTLKTYVESKGSDEEAVSELADSAKQD